MTPTTFKLTLSPDGTALRAYALALPDGTWRAWAPHALRILRKPYRHARSHLELTDDVVSSLYDPQGQRNMPAAFGLANVPDLGLLQVYGGPAVAKTVDQAVESAALNSARLGRFRQSRDNRARATARSWAARLGSRGSPGCGFRPEYRETGRESAKDRQCDDVRVAQCQVRCLVHIS